jgi:hypothetical protein
MPGKGNGEMPDQNTNPDSQQQEGETPASFEAWLESQDEQVKGLYETHVGGLRNTVKATRDERDALKSQIKELSSQVEKGSEIEKTLTEFSAKLEAAEKRAMFAEEASKPEIGCTNPKAAWLIAQADELFDRKGNPDWNAIKAAAPELFAKKTSRVNGGAGTGEPPPETASMNNYIRRAAGRS